MRAPTRSASSDDDLGSKGRSESRRLRSRRAVDLPATRTRTRSALAVASVAHRRRQCSRNRLWQAISDIGARTRAVAVAGRLQQAELTVAILAHANAEITALGEPTAEKRAESDTGSARGE